MRSLVHKKNSIREQLLQVNHKHGSRPKYINKDTDSSGSGPPKATFQRHQQKVNSVWFNYPHDYINTRYNNNEPTCLVNSTGEHNNE